MADLTKATFDGSTITLGQEQRIPQGQYRTRVSVGAKAAFVYRNDTTINSFIAVVPGRYWVEIPVSIVNTRNTVQLKPYVTSLLNAPEPVAPVVNTDDSYSLRDIAEFKSNVAVVSITGDYDWVDENSVKLGVNSVFQFKPNEGWAATITADDETLTVIPNENYTTMGRSGDDNLVTLDALQFVAQDGTVEVYSGDFKTGSTDARPIAYVGAFQQGERQVIEEFSNTVGGVQLVQMPYNAVTDTQGEYLVFASRNGESRRIGMFNTETEEFVSFDGLEDAQEFYNEYKQGLIDSEKFEQEQAAAQAAADAEAARKGKVIGSESRKSRVYNIKYIGEGKYAITNKDGLLIATYEAANDEEALVKATGEIDAYEAREFPKAQTNWGIVFASVLGLAVVVGLIVYVRTRKEA
tara:strand:- start:531 stop:1757 length:1227 start_codon:yes stop_codon:yes gene_type:complete